MATQLQIRRGTAAQVAAFTGAEGEIVYNSTNDSLHTNDGATAGGFELARADLNNVSDADLNAALTGNTLSALTITTLTAGAATFSAGITATTGTFSGAITSTLSAAGQGYVYLGNSAHGLQRNGSGATGDVNDVELYTIGGAGGIVLSTGGLGSAQFRMDTSGLVSLTGGITATTGTFSGSIALNTASTASTIIMARSTTGNNNMTKYSTGGTDEWIVGQRNDGTSNFRFYNYATASDVVSINATTGVATFSGGALEIGPAANKVIIKSQGSFQNTTLESHIINADGTGAFGSGDLLIQPRCSSVGLNNIVFGTSGGTNTTTERFRIGATGDITHRTNAGACYDHYIEGGISRGYIGSSNSLVSAGLTSMCFRGESGIILSIAGSQAVVIDASGNLTSTGNIIIDSPAGNPILNIIAAGGGGAAEVRLQTTGYTSAIYQYQGSVYHSTAAVRPATDNTTNLGGAAHRWNIIYCSNNVINTSDAREKTVVAKLTANEIEASKLLGKEIGTYKWLASIEEKGEGARTHIGMTVQRAIEIMESCDLDPIAYGFICYDEWEDDIAVEQPAIEAQDAVFDEDGKVVTPAIKAVDEITKTHALAGNRYGFRYDQLNQFIAAGFNARLEALEGA